MSHNKNGHRAELFKLFDALCEDRLSSQDWTRLEKILSADKKARKQYLDFVFLHGSLVWNAATDTETGTETVYANRFRRFLDHHSFEETKPQPVKNKIRTDSRSHVTSITPVENGKGRVTLAKISSAIALVFIAGFVLVFVWNPFTPIGNSSPKEIVRNRSDLNRNEQPQITLGPLKLPEVDNKRSIVDFKPLEAPRPINRDLIVPFHGSDDVAVVALIDKKIREAWKEEHLEPSAQANDHEWLRRVYLDIVGQIPSLEETNTFFADNRPYKRNQLIDDLLSDPRYVRHWTTIWSNLLVGRQPNEDVDRHALERFLRRSFSENRPWKDIVSDLVSAEGRSDENGATNFLIAHLNNQAVPATAITTRLFLGMQFQCTQCHDHPFNNSKQNQFWELNSFFKQTKKVTKRERNGVSGKLKTFSVLENRLLGGPSYYENRQSRMRAALPAFQGHKINDDAGTNRRQELARLFVSGNDTLVATAMVNRMWAHFFGFGFTAKIDDMGPHNKPSHPILLKRLSREFVQSGYDLKRLITWICSSEAYRLSSRFGEHNTVDNPEIGRVPWFSKMYVKSMTAEQLYDSLLVATGVTAVQRGTWDDVQKEREDWLTQFVVNFETEENDEASTFEGTISSALLMMNSPVIEMALSLKPGTFLEKTTVKKISRDEKIRLLALAALCRNPTAKEMKFFRLQLAQKTPSGQTKATKHARILQDIFWAYLNSNEFILIH